ncbi:MAG: hypothetical protein ABI832_21715 [bacterium]
MSVLRNIVFRSMSLVLLVTSIGVTALLLIIGYQAAIWIMDTGRTTGQISMVVLAGMPSLFALGSLPFWLTLQRMHR